MGDVTVRGDGSLGGINYGVFEVLFHDEMCDLSPIPQ